MIKKIKLMLLSMSMLLGFAMPLIATGGMASALINQDDINNQLCSGSNGGLGGNQGGNCNGAATDTANNLVKTVVDILSVVVGVVAVIMIIIAGFRYITSGGKQESVSGAKNTILYAIIGLIVVALAQLIVHFVLDKTTNTTS